MKKNKWKLILPLFVVLILANCNNTTNEKVIKEGKNKLSDFISSSKEKIEQPNKEEEAITIVVNQQHKFEITPCEFKYNNKVFQLGGSVEELVKVFGSYNRHIDFAHAYVWDDFGFSVLCNRHTEEPTEFRICFDCCEWIEPDDMEGTLPKSCFKGAILVDGVPLGNGVSFEGFKDKLGKSQSEIDFYGFYIRNKFIYYYNCKYDKVQIEDDSNHAIILSITEDTKYRIFSLNDSRPAHKLQIQYDKEQAEKEKQREYQNVSK